MITTKHASNSPVMFVTHESFAVLPGGGALGIFWVGMCRPGLCLRADVSYFLCCTRATKEIGDVCTQATRDSKLAPRSKKNSPKIDTPF